MLTKVTSVKLINMRPEVPLLKCLYFVRPYRRLAERPDYPAPYVGYDACEPRKKVTASRDLTQPPQRERHGCRRSPAIKHLHQGRRLHDT